MEGIIDYNRCNLCIILSWTVVTITAPKALFSLFSLNDAEKLVSKLDLTCPCHNTVPRDPLVCTSLCAAGVMIFIDYNTLYTCLVCIMTYLDAVLSHMRS